MNLLTRVFSDGLSDPKFLDHLGLNWSYPIKPWDMSVVPQGQGDGIKTGVYKSMPIPVGAVLKGYLPSALDALIYLHGANGAMLGGVRALCWKPGTPNPVGTKPNPTGTQMLVWHQRGDQAMLDCIPGAVDTTSAAVYVLRVNEIPETLQILVSQNCTGVSVYLRKPSYALSSSQFIQTEGVH